MQNCADIAVGYLRRRGWVDRWMWVNRWKESPSVCRGRRAERRAATSDECSRVVLQQTLHYNNGLGALGILLWIRIYKGERGDLTWLLDHTRVLQHSLGPRRNKIVSRWLGCATLTQL